jgi:hypothetical protein
VVGVLVVGFATLWAYWCPFGAVLIGMAPPPAFPAKWGTN